MDTVKISVLAPVSVQEILVAELSALPVDGFEQDDERLKIFVRESAWTPSVRDTVLQVVGLRTTPQGCDVTLVRAENWNRLWEESIVPVSVPPFYIRPSWTDDWSADPDVIELIIDPKMSFGTGHHESTRLALQQMAALPRRPIDVLDVGTGTGILAIAASKLGASSVLGIDVDDWATKNANENVVLNDVTGSVEIRNGEIDVVMEDAFDLILANINRNVIVADLAKYKNRLANEGILILSGLQLTDVSIVSSAAQRHDLQIAQEQTEADWWSASFSHI